jgi:hypothetical protein
MNVAIIPTAYRTIFFHALATRLENLGHQAFWLSPNARWARWLYRNGVPTDRVLDLTRNGEAWKAGSEPSADDLSRLASLEANARLAMNDIMLMDPLLIRRPRQRALRYLATCERAITRFLDDHAIEVVFGEQTWAVELLIGQICFARGTPHLVPHTVRIPDPRFAFFNGHTESELVYIRDTTPHDREDARLALESFRTRKPRPEYMRVNRSVLRPSWERIRTLAIHVKDLAGDPFDETSRRPAGLIFDHSKQVARGVFNRATVKWENPQGAQRRPYVFFPLHKQPEASIDIKGRPFSNQVEIIRALARTLPVSHDLYVKEHVVALNTRPPSFYREVREIPGVRLIDPQADSFAVISGADLVVTITGTAAYEAALLGRRSATIAPIFFDRLVARPQFDPFRDSLVETLQGADFRPRSADQLVEALAWILANSFPGLVGDAFWQPHSMANENLDQVSAGFEAILERIPTSSSGRVAPGGPLPEHATEEVVHRNP